MKPLIIVLITAILFFTLGMIIGAIAISQFKKRKRNAKARMLRFKSVAHLPKCVTGCDSINCDVWCRGKALWHRDHN